MSRKTKSESVMEEETSTERKSEPNNKKKGNIQLIIGPMFSGKSTELMKRINRYAQANKKHTIIKYAGDTRYSSFDEKVYSHDGNTMPAITAWNLADVPDAILQDSHVIGIDEGQFFSDTEKFADLWANQGKIVVVAALDATHERKPFGDILNLLPKCEYIDKLTAVCVHCDGDASFSERFTSEIKTIVIGGSKKYRAVCRNCCSNDQK